MKRFITIIYLLFALPSYMFAQCTPNYSASGDIANAIALVTYNGQSFTGSLVNNSDEDGKYYFITSMIPFHPNCGSQPSPTNHISNISFKWQNGQTTTGATLLSNWVHDEFVAILELDIAPPFEEISYLGFNLGGSGSYSFAYYNSALYEYSVSSSTTGNIGVNCSNGISYSFNNGGTNTTVISEWSEEANLQESNKPLGSPLLDNNGRIVGIYVNKSGGVYEETRYDENDEPYTVTICSEDDAHYVNYFSDATPNIVLSSTLRSIKIEPCVDEILKNALIDDDLTEKANIRIIGKSKINDVQVRFQAGIEVILDDGFESGNDFIAEIKPCVSKITALAKTNDEGGIIVENKVEERIITSEKDINAYPTVLANHQITLESEGLSYVQYFLTDLQGKVLLKNNYYIENNKSTTKIDLPNLSSGIYLLYLNDGQFSKTIKLIKE